MHIILMIYFNVLFYLLLLLKMHHLPQHLFTYGAWKQKDLRIQYILSMKLHFLLDTKKKQDLYKNSMHKIYSQYIYIEFYSTL